MTSWSRAVEWFSSSPWRIPLLLSTSTRLTVEWCVWMSTPSIPTWSLSVSMMVVWVSTTYRKKNPSIGVQPKMANIQTPSGRYNNSVVCYWNFCKHSLVSNCHRILEINVLVIIYWFFSLINRLDGKRMTWKITTTFTPCPLMVE